MALIAVFAVSGIFAVLMGIYFLPQFIMLRLNAHAVSSDYPVADYKINYRDYSRFHNDIEWSMCEPTSIVKDNRFTEDYLVYGENYDVIYCTDDELYIKNELERPDSPLLKNVASVTFGEYTYCKSGFNVDLDLDSEQCYNLLELITDDSIGDRFDFDGKYEILRSPFREDDETNWWYPLRWFLTVSYNDTPDMCFDGLTYNFMGHFYFAKDENDDLFIICNNTKAKKLPADIAEEIMDKLFTETAS